VTLDRRPDIACSILAPLAVVPAFQRRGVGRALIEHGARVLAESGVKLIFVLGDPAYYTRCGFGPATPHGLRAPYPIVPEEAWMVRSLVPGLLGKVEGTVACAASLARPEYWRE
jgi:putative acetyltransferase